MSRTLPRHLVIALVLGVVLWFLTGLGLGAIVGVLT